MTQDSKQAQVPQDKQQSQATPQTKKRQRMVVAIAILLFYLTSTWILWRMQFPPYIVAIPTFILILAGLIYAGYTPKWSKWTGFGEYKDLSAAKGTDTQRAKTLWDWFQFLGTLAIPIIVVIVAASFSAQQNHDLQIAAQQHQNDLAITKDQQEQATLVTYLDRMQELLTNAHLSDPKAPDEVRAIARARTLTALANLDPERKRTLLQFLYEAKLIVANNTIVDLFGADLSGADLSGVILG
jgi:hypothetical protein